MNTTLFFVLGIIIFLVLSVVITIVAKKILNKSNVSNINNNSDSNEKQNNLEEVSYTARDFGKNERQKPILSTEQEKTNLTAKTDSFTNNENDINDDKNEDDNNKELDDSVEEGERLDDNKKEKKNNNMSFDLEERGKLKISSISNDQLNYTTIDNQRINNNQRLNRSI